MRTEKSVEEMKSLFNLNGQTAIVTGASGALGRKISLGFAAHGVNIVACSNEEQALNELSAEIEALGVKALAVYCDVTDTGSVENMVNQAVNKFGQIDILFTGAGIAHREPLVEMDIEDWQKVMDVNVKGTLVCCKVVGKAMIKAGKGGSVITVGSVRGFHGHKDGYTAYGTSKAAVHYITKALAFEWADYNIRVNCIAPCVFWSKLTEPILSDEVSYNQYTERIPLGRAAEPDDFVGAALYLASEASAMVTAHILSVDGGTVGG